jgi:hypothetical protein
MCIALYVQRGAVCVGVCSNSSCLLKFRFLSVCFVPDMSSSVLDTLAKTQKKASKKKTTLVVKSESSKPAARKPKPATPRALKTRSIQLDYAGCIERQLAAPIHLSLLPPRCLLSHSTSTTACSSDGKSHTHTHSKTMTINTAEEEEGKSNRPPLPCRRRRRRPLPPQAPVAKKKLKLHHQATTTR